MDRNEQKSAQQIKRGTLVSYAAIGLNIVSGLLYTPWMINQIGRSDYALYTLAVSLITMFTIDFGMSAAVSRFVAKYNAEGNAEATNNFLGLVYKLYGVISAVLLVALLGGYFFVDRIYVSLTPTEIDRFRVVYMIAGGYSVFSFPFITLNGIMNAYERFVELKLCDFFEKLLTVILIAAALLAGGNVYALVAVNAMVGLTSICLKCTIISKNTDIRINFRFFSLDELREIFGYSMWSTIYSVAHSFLVNITPSILAIVSNSVEVAVFGFGNSIGSYVYILAMGVDGFFLPKVSRMVAVRSHPDDYLELMVKVGRFQLYILGLIAVGFTLLGREFIELLMGEDYLGAYYCVIFCLVYSVVCYPQQIANTMVIAMNRVKERALISVVAAFTNVGLSYVLSRHWGAAGAYASISVAILIRTLLMNILYKTKLNMKVGVFFRKCHLALLPVFVISAVVAQLAISWLGSGSWIVFAVKVCIIVVVYALCACLIGLNKEEKSVVMEMIPRKRSK